MEVKEKISEKKQRDIQGALVKKLKSDFEKIIERSEVVGGYTNRVHQV